MSSFPTASRHQPPATSSSSLHPQQHQGAPTQGPSPLPSSVPASFQHIPVLPSQLSALSKLVATLANANNSSATNARGGASGGAGGGAPGGEEQTVSSTAQQPSTTKRGKARRGKQTQHQQMGAQAPQPQLLEMKDHMVTGGASSKQLQQQVPPPVIPAAMYGSSSAAANTDWSSSVFAAALQPSQQATLASAERLRTFFSDIFSAQELHE